MRIGDNIVNEFNEFSVNYTDDMINCVPHYLKLLSSFTEDLPEDFTPQYILDLGCGNGNVTSRLLELFPKSNFVLLDASQEMINLCRMRFEGYTVEYITSYFNDFRFKDDHYDMITAGFSLHHCDSKEKQILFRKINKSLKKGGIFGYSDLMVNKNKPEHLKLLKEWSNFVHKSFPDGEKWEWLMEHYDKFDRPDSYNHQIKWLKQAGFKNIRLTTKESYWVHLRAIKE